MGKPNTWDLTNTGYKPPAAPDPRNFKLEALQAAVPIPTAYKTDLSKMPVFFQGKIPDCVENSVTFVKEYYDWKATGTLPNLSRRFLAIETVQADGFPFSDGTSVLNAQKLAQKVGICEASLLIDDHSLDESTFISAPITQGMLDNAITHKIASYAFLSNLSFQGIKNAIYQNGVVIVGATIDKNWWTDVNGNGSWDAKDILPLRLPTDTATKSGHCFVLYGYDEQYIYFRNSFGPTWGSGGDGYFGANYIPYISEVCAIVDLTPQQVQQVKQANQIVNTINSLQNVETPKNKGIIETIITELWAMFIALFSPSSIAGDAPQMYTNNRMSNTLKSVIHGAVSVALFAIPIVMMNGASWESMTLGGVLNAVYHWLTLYNSTASA